MTVLSRVCAEFRDQAGAVLYTIHANQLLMPLTDVPDAIRQDPLFDMMVTEGSLEVLTKKEDLKRAENDPEKKPVKTESAKTEASEKPGQPAQSEANASGAKAAAKK